MVSSLFLKRSWVFVNFRFIFIGILTWEQHRTFKDALFLKGKDFPLIQRVWFPEKTPAQLVEFYYLWKKKEGFHTSELEVTPPDPMDYMISVYCDIDWVEVEKDYLANVKSMSLTSPDVNSSDKI